MKKQLILSLVIMIAITCSLSGCTEKDEDGVTVNSLDNYNVSLGETEINGLTLSVDSGSNDTATIRYTVEGTEYRQRIYLNDSINWGNDSLRYIGCEFPDNRTPRASLLLTIEVS